MQNKKYHLIKEKDFHNILKIIQFIKLVYQKHQKTQFHFHLVQQLLIEWIAFKCFQKNGINFIIIRKGNPSQEVSNVCPFYGGFYLVSIGQAVTILTEQNIRKLN
jgi:hypothetical protein